jgi:hypothetical protein
VHAPRDAATTGHALPAPAQLAAQLAARDLFHLGLANWTWTRCAQSPAPGLGMSPRDAATTEHALPAYSIGLDMPILARDHWT